MEIKPDKLTAEEAQALFDQLHDMGHRASDIDPVQALMDAKNMHIRDLQQMVSIESGTAQKLLNMLITARPPAPGRSEPQH